MYADAFDSAALVYVLLLAHTLWQAPLWAAALWVGLRLIPARCLEWRYGLTLAALGGIVGSVLLTGSLMRLQPNSPSAAAATITPSGQAAEVAAESPAVADGGKAAASPPAAPAGRAEQPMPLSPTRLTAAPAEGDGPSATTSGWPTAVALLWLIGATLMLARRVRHLLAARALAEGEAIGDPALLEILERVKRIFGIRHVVRLVASDELSTPVVVGALRPTLVLPVSLMTGLSPVELQAIFAHELAHIRRHDFLVNLVQLMVEAFLFFNPAVWWISGQVRREREACCDAMAVSVTHSPVRYAEVLVGWVEGVRRDGAGATGSRAAVAMVGSEPSSLLDRVERLLTPGYRPTQRVSRRACMTTLLLAVAGLVALQRGSDLAVAVAAQLITDQERIERLVEVRETIHGDVADADGSYTLAGNVRTSDGKPLPRISVVVHEIMPGMHSVSSKHLDRERFEYEVRTGKTWVVFNAPGYAAAIRGPFSSQPNTTVTVPDIELRAGFSAPVRVIDGEGDPVTGAEVRVVAKTDGISFHTSEPATTDGEGIAAIPHLADYTYDARVQAAGLQPLEANDIRFEPGSEVVLVPERSVSTSGVVLDPEGDPAAGIEVWQYKVERPGMGNFTARQLAVTDAEGRFSLDQLRDDSTYTIYLQDQERVAQVIYDVQAGQSDLQWQLAPELTAEGRVTGEIPSPGDAAPATIRYSNPVGASPGDRVTARGPVREAALDADGRFSIQQLSPGELVLQVAGRSFRFDLPESRDDLVVDLSAPETTLAKRPVILSFQSDGDPVSLRGSATFQSRSTAGDRANATKNHEQISVEFDGPTARLEAFAPGTLYSSQRETIGFWFDDLHHDVPAGDEPYRATIDVLPAGAVTGQVLRADGTPATDRRINVGCRMVYRPDSGTEMTKSTPNVQVNERGEFFVSPVILGAEAVLRVSDGHNIQVSEPFILEADDPTTEIDVTLPPPVDVHGVVVDEEGNPVPQIPVALRFEHEHASTSFSPPVITGRDGRFEFEGVNAEVGEYSVEFESRRDFVPVRVPVRTDGQPTEIRLQKGHIVTGTVVDKQGDPVPEAGVYAHPMDWQPASGEPYAYEAEEKTDAEGRFRLSNLPDRPVQLNARPMGDLNRVVVRPAANPPAPNVTLRGDVPDWHRSRAIDQ